MTILHVPTSRAPTRAGLLSESELTQLAFLASGLLLAPSGSAAREAIDRVRDLNGPFSPSIDKQVGGLLKALPAGPMTLSDWRRLRLRLVSRYPGMARALDGAIHTALAMRTGYHP